MIVGDLLAGMMQAEKRTSTDVLARYRQLDETLIRGYVDDCYDILCGDYGNAAKAELEGFLGRVYVVDQIRLDG